MLVEKWALLYLQITQHYSKPRVTPVEVLPVFPDFKVNYHFIEFINFFWGGYAKYLAQSLT